MKLVLLFSLVCTLFFGPVGQLSAAESGRVFLGYYSALGGLEVHKIPFGQLTHVSHAFQAVDAKGKLIEAEHVPNPALPAAAHKEGVKVLLALGGGKSAEGLTRLAKHEGWLNTYAKKTAQMAVENDYDGIDLVWEFPNDRATRAGFVKLVSLLRSELDQAAKATDRSEPYLLTAMVPHLGKLGKWIDTGAVLGKLDWLNVAAYDMSGPWARTAGHHAPLLPSPNDPEKGWRSVSGAMQYWEQERGVPKHKLVLGVPMYGRALPVDKVHQPLDPDKLKQHGSLPFTRLRAMVDDGWKAMWDRDAKAPWMQPNQQGEQPVMICYDDRNSVHRKAEWTQQQGYRGLYFWAIHQDRMSDGTHWLLTAADKVWPAESKE